MRVDYEVEVTVKLELNEQEAIRLKRVLKRAKEDPEISGQHPFITDLLKKLDKIAE